MLQMQSGAGENAHFLFGAFISMPWSWAAQHPSSGQTLWTWSLTRPEVMAFYLSRYKLTLPILGQEGAVKLGCLSHCSGLWIWEQGPFLDSAENLHSLLHSWPSMKLTLESFLFMSGINLLFTCHIYLRQITPFGKDQEFVALNQNFSLFCGFRDCKITDFMKMHTLMIGCI